MARYDHLPIWKTALELAVATERAVAHFPRSHKYALGTDLRRTAQQCCALVVRALMTLGARYRVSRRRVGTPCPPNVATTNSRGAAALIPVFPGEAMVGTGCPPYVDLRSAQTAPVFLRVAREARRAGVLSEAGVVVVRKFV